MYTGTLISDLFKTLDKAEAKTETPAQTVPPADDADDDIMLERESRVSAPLTIDEVLDAHKQYVDLSAKAAAEAREIEQIERMFVGRDAAIREKYPIEFIDTVNPYESLVRSVGRWL